MQNMDIRKIISSGKLELFAKDELNEKEAAEIQQLLMENLELGEALEHIYSRLFDQQ